MANALLNYYVFKRFKSNLEQFITMKWTLNNKLSSLPVLYFIETKKYVVLTR